MQAPHDAFFRRVFARPKRLAGLLRAVLPPEVAAGLELDALEMASPIRVDEALKGQVSDLVCRVPVQGGGATLVVDFLPEHQSTRLPEMALRSAVYATQHMLEAARERSRSRGVGMPPAVCVLFYTGPGRWRGPVQLHALLPALAKLPGLAPFVPDVRLLVLEVDRLSEEELAALPLDPYGQVALAAFRRVRSERPLEGLVRDLERVQGGAVAPEPGDVRSLLWYYAGVARGAMREDILSLPDRLVSPEDKMTAAEEWMKLGEARGEARGRAEEARRILRNLLQLKFGAVPQSLSSRIDAATHDALEQAVGRILTATSPDSVL
jgi:hypothetical protein